MPSKPRILVVDDEENQCTLLKGFLTSAGYTVETARSGSEALDILERTSWDIQLILSDLNMPDLTGVDLLKRVKSKSPETDFILITAHGTIETAISAVKLGAFDYLLKPIEMDDLLHRIEKLVSLRETQVRVEDLEKENRDLRGGTQPVAESKVMKSLFKELDRISKTDASVLFLGETGVGKEVLARYVHDHSTRRKSPFIAVNCSAIPENLMESEFFGFEKGAFTGADRRNIGFFERATSGTLFLDEIGELDLKLQPKILRAIEERKIRRVAGASDIPINVRFIAATHRNLKQLVSEKRFREDLYYRLNVVKIEIPPLRDRKEDIPALVNHLIKRHSAQLKVKIHEIDPEYLAILLDYSFPGNVRELSNIVERSIIYQVGGRLTAAQLPSDLGESLSNSPCTNDKTEITGDTSLFSAIGNFEKNLIINQLQSVQGNVEKAASNLKLPKSTLYSKMAKYGIK